MALPRPPPSPLAESARLGLLLFVAAASAAPPTSTEDAPSPSSSSLWSLLTRLITILFAAAVVPGLVYVFYPAIKAAAAGGAEGLATEEALGGMESGNPGPHKNESPPVLSLVVPAYNEEERLPVMLDHTIGHLRRDRKSVVERCVSAAGDGASAARAAAAAPFEIVIVDDGSKDGTSAVVRKYAAELSGGASTKDVRIRLVHMRRNSGKGAAVRAGMIRSGGALCLMVDADDATDFPEGLAKVLDEMGRLLREGGKGAAAESNGGGGGDGGGGDGGGGAAAPPAAVFGSRAHLEEASCAERSPVRTFLMHAFHFFVRTLCSHRIKDTQCGFKLFTRSGAAVLFSNLHLRRWAFDTELVVVAEILGVPLAEVGVKWHEVEGSKLDTDKLTLALVSLGMLRDMVCVRACYTLGIWRVKR